MKNIQSKVNKFIAVCVTTLLVSTFYANNVANANTNIQKVPLTSEIAQKISQGKITYENNKLDPLLYNKPPLDPESDDDGDGIKNKSEIFVYSENNRTYYKYFSHPRIKDTDGDGIQDNQEANLHDRLTWNLSPRDMALFMELAYREEHYIKQILDENLPNVPLYEGRSEYSIIKKELAPYWNLKQVHQDNEGFFAILLESVSPFEYLNNGAVQVLAIRGTAGGTSGGDLDDDIAIGFGGNPDQAVSVERLMDTYNQNGTVNNLYVTGHSLGGYLSQRAIIHATDNNYNWLKKAYTFNAPRIKRSIFRPRIKELAQKGDIITEQGRAVHYATDNDSITNTVGRFKGYISVGKSAQGHGSRSYFEERMNGFPGFTVGDRRNIHGTGIDNQTSFGTKVNDERFINTPEKLLYDPIATPIEITKGEQYNLFNAITVAEGTAPLPSNVSMTDVTPAENRPDINVPNTYIAKVKITYSDRSNVTIDVPVTVRKISDAQIYDPIPISISVYENTEIDYKLGVTARQGTPELPENITVRSITKIDNSTVGDYNVTAEVIYADNTKDILEIPVKIIRTPQNRTYNLQAIDEIINEGETYNITDNITSNDSSSPLPNDVIFKDITPPNTIDVNTPNENGYNGIVKVTYSDSSYEEVIVKVIVHKLPDNVKYSPTGKQIQVDYNEDVNPERIVNTNGLPQNTSYTWKEGFAPNTSTYGSKQSIVLVTYPDTTVDEVNVNVNVTALNTKYTPASTGLIVDENLQITEEQILSTVHEGLPTEYKVQKTSKQNQTIPTSIGTHNYVVLVIYPDTSIDEVNVQIQINELPRTEVPQPEALHEGDRVIKGDGIPNATITLYLADEIITESTVQQNGKWQIELDNPVNVSNMYSVKQQEMNKHSSSLVNIEVSPKNTPKVYLYKQDGNDSNLGRVTENQINGTNASEEVPQENILYLIKGVPSRVLLKADDIDNDLVDLKVSNELEGNDIGIAGIKLDNVQNTTNIVSSNNGREILTELVGTPQEAGQYNIYLTATDVIAKKSVKKFKVVVLDLQAKNLRLKPNQNPSSISNNASDWVNTKQNSPALPENTIVTWINKPTRNNGENLGKIKVELDGKRYVNLPVSLTVETAPTLHLYKENNNDDSKVYKGSKTPQQISSENEIFIFKTTSEQDAENIVINLSAKDSTNNLRSIAIQNESLPQGLWLGTRNNHTLVSASNNNSNIIETQVLGNSNDFVLGSKNTVFVATDSDNNETLMAYKFTTLKAPQSKLLTVAVNTGLSASAHRTIVDAEEATKQTGDHLSYPQGTSFSWKENKVPDTSEDGLVNSIVEIVYPNGQKRELPVQILVIETNAPIVTNINSEDVTNTIEPIEVTIYKTENILIPVEITDNKAVTQVNIENLLSGLTLNKKTINTANSVIEIKGKVSDDYQIGQKQKITLIATDERNNTNRKDFYIVIGSQADKYVPVSRNIVLNYGDNLPEVQSIIINKNTDNSDNALPENSRYEFVGEITTTEIGNLEKEIKVTYPDGSVENVTFELSVNDNVYPKLLKVSNKVFNEQTVVQFTKTENINVFLEFSDNNKIISINAQNLPQGSTLEVLEGLGTKSVSARIVGNIPANVAIDLSTKTTIVINDSVNEKTEVINISELQQNQKYTPHTTNVTVNVNEQLVDPQERITNKYTDNVSTDEKLPMNTKFAWYEGNPDTSMKGRFTKQIEVLYPDNSSEKIEVTIEVVEDYKSILKNKLQSEANKISDSCKLSMKKALSLNDIIQKIITKLQTASIEIDNSTSYEMGNLVFENAKLELQQISCVFIDKVLDQNIPSINFPIYDLLPVVEELIHEINMSKKLDLTNKTKDSKDNFINKLSKSEKFYTAISENTNRQEILSIISELVIARQMLKNIENNEETLSDITIPKANKPKNDIIDNKENMKNTKPVLLIRKQLYDSGFKYDFIFYTLALLGLGILFTRKNKNKK